MAETNIKKNASGYGYKYTDLAEIHNYLESIEARYIQRIVRVDNDDYIETKRCFKDKWEEEWITGCRVVQATLSGKSNPAQEQGSALTYARRYSVLMAFGLATTDDDAQLLTRDSNSTTSYQQEKGKKESIKKETKKKQDANELTARDKIQILAEERGIALSDIAKEYGLNRTTTDERFEEVLAIMEGRQNG